MRYTAFLLVILAGCNCGSNSSNEDTPPGGDDMAPPIDAPPLPACAPRNGTTISVRQIGAQITNESVMLVTSPPNDGRLFVVLQGGRIMILENEVLNPTPFIDLDALSGINFTPGVPQGETGLLGLAFHPNYAFNREFYVFYTRGGCPSCTNVVARYHQSTTNPNVAETTGEDILVIDDFAGNHNGGMIEFGKDGFLYIATGDGGGSGDPQRAAQNANNLLGKMLRIDVNNPSGGKLYGIPADNPFVAGGGAPEVFMLGLRNPWRWSFDRETGDMYIGDVGQGALEELTVIPAGQQAGKNLGWSKYEGTRCFGNYTPCVDGENNTGGFTGPQYTRPRGDGWLAIIGGEVYRGDCFPDIQGQYFVTDNTSHELVRGTFAGGTFTPQSLGTSWPTGPASIHSDARGELFLTTTNGRIFQIEAGP